MNLAGNALTSVDDYAPSRVLMIRNRAIITAVSALVFLPSLLFAWSLRPIPAALVTIGCLGAFALTLRLGAETRDGFLDQPVEAPRLVICFGIALIVLLLGGETHVFYATSDWLVRDAVLADLVRTGSPVTYDVDGVPYVLRAPLGMYMVPALVGRSLGLIAAHAALLVQNAIFLACTLYLLLRAAGGRWRIIAILLSFSGLSIIGALTRNAAVHDADANTWLARGLDSWHPLYQYTSSIAQFFWVPNHALPGWWLATLMLIQKPARLDVATLGVSVAGLIFWSPLAILPAVPWLLWTAVSAWRPVFLKARTWLGVAASLGFLPLVAFLLTSSDSMAQASPWSNENFGFFYTIFIVLGAPSLFFLALFWRHIKHEHRALVVVNAIVLLVLPFFNFGVHNDLVMRGSIASLTIVAFVFALVLDDLIEARSPGSLLGMSLVFVGLASPAVEVARALAKPRYVISTCSMMESSRALGDQGLPVNYIAANTAIPPWLITLPSKPAITIEQQTCWPGLKLHEGKLKAAL